MAASQSPALAIIIMDEMRRIFMHHRDNIPQIAFPDHWCVPCGGMEPQDGYDPIAGIYREVGEEIKVDTGSGLIDYVPSRVTLVEIGRYVDHSQDCDQYLFAAKLEAPFESLIFNEGARKETAMFDRDRIANTKIAANYGELCLRYYDRLRN